MGGQGKCFGMRWGLTLMLVEQTWSELPSGGGCFCLLVFAGTSDVARRRRGTSDVFPPYWAESAATLWRVWLHDAGANELFSVPYRMHRPSGRV